MFTIKKYILYSITIFNLTYATSIPSLNILHLSFHTGCIREIEAIAQAVNVNLTSLFIPDLQPKEFDGITTGNALYNISHDRAQNIWNKHKDYFNQFDAIITSDTAPLSRIFLQNGYEKPLIIWVCNRFDYTDHGSLDCDFPDEEYYQLFQEAQSKKNVFVVPYTSFEALYAAQKNIIFNHEPIKPIGILPSTKTSYIPSNIDRSTTFFIPPYLNDASMKTSEKCAQLGIITYHGKYNGPNDLQGFKGIIHMPYAWSNLAFFENMQQGIPYFIPSITFMMQNINEGTMWWATGNYFKENYHLAEWYNDEYKDIITYFDSWEDLKDKINSINFKTLQSKIKKYAKLHSAKIINQWRDIITQINSYYSTINLTGILPNVAINVQNNLLSLNANI